MPSDVENAPLVEKEKTGFEHAPKPKGPAIPLARYIVVLAFLLVAIPLTRYADRAHASDQWSHNVGLKDMPREVAEWKTYRDNDFDSISLEQLTPDDYIWRTYVDPMEIPLDFLVVYGHKKNTFHSPGFCLPGGGWQIMDKTEEPVSAGGLPMPMNLFIIQRQVQGQSVHQVVLYCFMQGDKATPSLVQHNLNLLAAHLQRRRATGALVRVIIPVTSTDDAAVARATDFIKRIYPELRQRIG